MSLFLNIFISLWARLQLLANGLFSLLKLIWIGISSLFGEGTIGSRLGAKLSSPGGQRTIFAVLRAFWPNLVLKKQLVKAYENNGTAVVTRFSDVKEMLDRDDDFHVVYGPRMDKITDGENFFLGMQNTARYQRDTSNMRIAARRTDVGEIIVPRAAVTAQELIADCPGKIDVPQELSLKVPADMVGKYFGVPGRTGQDMIDWTTKLFWYLFIDLQGDEKLEADALEAGSELGAYLDEAVKERKANPTTDEDLLNRLLEMQKSELPGTSDLDIRNNLLGLCIGAIITISSASIKALNQLLDRPGELRKAQEAARADDDGLLAEYLFEAFRFDPLNPVIYRRASKDTYIARSTLRQRKIRKGTLVFAANLSAMFDPLELKNPGSFKPGRPWDHYILWGYGLHTCFGAHINSAVIPQLLKPLLKKKNLRRAPGDAGQIDSAETPFPVHLHLEFDA